MLHILSNKRHFYNKTLMDYCKKSTDESIKRLVERKNANLLGDYNKTEINFSTNCLHLNKSLIIGEKSAAFLMFLSLSPIVYLFLNRK